MKKPTPWISTIRVFKITHEEVIMLRKLYESKNMHRVSCGSLNFAAACGNEIISNMIRESKNER